MNELDVLKAGRELLSDPNRWTKRTLARDKNYERVDSPFDKNAACFCSVGAIHKLVGPNDDITRPLKASVVSCLNASVESLAGRGVSVIDFNDNPQTTHDQLLAVWDHAIAHYQ